MSDSPLYPLLQELATHERHAPHNPQVRLAVRLRARDACEYCLLPTLGEFHVDHIIPRSRWSDYCAGRLRAPRPTTTRRGPDHLDNFAWCCPFCNTVKGPQVASRVGAGLVRLFDPRRDQWPEHFVFLHQFLLIAGVSPIGRASERALRLNDPSHGGPLGARHELILAGRYPPSWALSWTVAHRQ